MTGLRYFGQSRCYCPTFGQGVCWATSVYRTWTYHYATRNILTSPPAVQAFPPNRSLTQVNKVKTQEDILMMAGPLNSRSGMGFKIQHLTQLTAMMASQSLSYPLILDQFLYHLLQVRQTTSWIRTFDVVI